MRKQLLYFGFLVGLLQASLCVAQLPGSRIISFDGFITNNLVGLRFTVSKGNACTGYNIFHSTDSLNFNPIYQYAGICGSTTKDEQFSYTHQNPALDVVNYYQVELIPADRSKILRIFVSQTPQISVIPFPNPTKDILNIKIVNTNNLKLVAFIFSPFGQPEQQVLVDAKLDVVTLDVQNLARGVHVIFLTDGNQVFPTKFIKE